ncbi:polysaccharide biosynthesis protein [Asanoa sp. WMMD1127]|uniref:polysaccharide biosynthesis protein n=1 Tax=Asanoa sp. WMMD1127 TaxID=3016107 RepID=UPI002415B00E|nr:polysaccharide biosynthesis protein [Asanoa sp. WMMD1127]MDG4822329.1 polysaccharide biosynthesis protein [Asanoa sp. WMMD1127]
MSALTRQPATKSSARSRRIATAGAAVAIAGALTNALGYLVPVIGARQLSSADLSALATVLGLTAIASVPGLGLQIAIAVHRARNGAGRTAGISLATTVVGGGALLILAPVLVPLFDLPAIYTLLAALATVPTVLAGRWLGELQGDQRFLRLAAGMAVLAVGRYAGLIAGLVAGAGLTASLVTGAIVAWLVPPALWVLSRSRKPHVADPIRAREVLTAFSATLAMLVASYADLLLARHLLTPDASGAYSVGTVLTKGALWAPQVVTVLALPRLAQGSRRALRKALLLVAKCGAVLVAASAVAGGFAFALAGGADYTHLGRYAPIFAATGALYAVVFVLVNDRVATATRWASAPVWIAIAALVVVAEFIAPHSLTGVMWSALGAAALALLLSATSDLLRKPRG